MESRIVHNMNAKQKAAINRVAQAANAYMLSPYFLFVFLNDMIKYFSIKEQAYLSQSCYHLHTIFKPILNQSLYKKLLQSVIDDEREVVNKILDVKPELLVEDPPKTLVIESQKTWQRFRAEKPLSMAIKREQIEMVKALLPHFEKLHNGQAEALGQWVICDANKKKTKCYAGIKAIIHVIAKENFQNDHPRWDYLIDRISEKTQTVLEAFRKKLIPDRAITLDNYFNVEKLFITSLYAFFDCKRLFQNNEQRKLYMNVVIGSIQSVFTPELAKIFCEYFNHVGVEEGKCLSKLAQSLMLSDYAMSFYRPKRDSLSGLGFHYAVGGDGLVLRTVPSDAVDRCLRLLASCFEEWVAQKQRELARLKNNLREDIDIEEMITLYNSTKTFK